MVRRAVKNALRSIHGKLLRRIARIAGEELPRPAVVFSPHFDDETLGCGGTIILKRRAGADVGVVFMTDGCRSHAKLIPARELAALRRQEGLAACRALGVAEDRVVLLGHKETRLSECADEAVRTVHEVLERCRPAEVFVPYHDDGNVDHVATNRIVMAALAVWGGMVAVNEYPIWFWNQWPWVRLPLGHYRWAMAMAMARRSVRSWFGVRLLREFRWAVPVGEVLDGKRAALDCHKTQMTRHTGKPDWPVLGDVGGGEFLESFFLPYEVFHRGRCEGSERCNCRRGSSGVSSSRTSAG